MAGDAGQHEDPGIGMDAQIDLGRPQGDRAVAGERERRAAELDRVNAEHDVIARRTPGFTGADLANVINEAALLTARFDRKQIDMATLEESIDRVMAGPERKTRVMSESPPGFIIT